MARKTSGGRSDTSTAERILDGALRAAEEHGVRHLTMDLIARYAGLARVTIYGHYSNKDAIMAALVGRELSRILSAIEPLAATTEEPVQRMTDVFVYGFEWLRDHALLQRLIRTEPETILPYAAYDSPLLVYGRQQVSRWMARIFTGKDDTAEAERFNDAAELGVRITQSLLLSPVSHYDLRDAQDVRSIAQNWLLPVILATTDYVQSADKVGTSPSQ